MKLATLILAVLGLVVMSANPADAQWYARGSYYNGWAADDGNILNDAGENGDEVAGDGIHSGFVTSTELASADPHLFKIADIDWAMSCPSSDVPIMLDVDNQVCFFRLDTNEYVDGWYPTSCIVWSDALRMGDSWGLVGSGDHFGNWDPTVGPATPMNEDGLYEAIVDIPIGDWEYKWTANQVWDVQQFGGDGFGNNTWNVALSVTEPGPYQFLLDPLTGRGTHQPYEPVPTEEMTWGEVKTLFR